MSLVKKEFNVSLEDGKILGTVDFNRDGNPSMVMKLFVEEDIKVLEEILQGDHSHKFKFDTKFDGGRVTIYLLNREDGKNLWSHEVNLLDFFLEFKDKLTQK